MEKNYNQILYVVGGGPTVVGVISGIWNDNLKTGILAATLFPVLLLAGILYTRKKKPL